jgi:uncharacterized BrkB/YihY/UPF0761 family membrane protein
MTELVKFFIAVMIAISGIAQILTDPRITRKFLYKTALAFLVYAVHCAAGFTALWWLLPKGPDAALGATAATVGWIGFGMLGLIRFVPRLREPPAWLLHVGMADLVCLMLIVGGVASATGLI